jgi:formate hydrogenlyase subunit 3/multisubunit Na+/H+ antiporter MnhD subunit
MRRALLILIGALAVTGVPLVLAAAGEEAPGWRKALALLHIWGGIFFLVVFPLYAWDHVRANRVWLRCLASVTVSGTTQLLAGTLLILTGVLLLLYQRESWPVLRALHHTLTYVLIASIGVHFLSPKR